MKVAIVGATGETGRSIVDGLVNSDVHFEITALVRPSSLEKPRVQDLKARSIHVVSADLQGPQDELINILKGIDVVISAIHYQSLSDEIPLATAAKVARVKRYVPCFFATVAPRGVMYLHDLKEDILGHINRLYLPYTVINVGWWYQITLPRVPSGRFDYALLAPNNTVFAGGNVPIAFTDVRDIGKYVARIISDPQTLNKKVFAFTETKTQKQVFELVEKLSGERLERTEVSAADLELKLNEFRKSNTLDQMRASYEYYNSWGVRGDNSPDHARYLGYLIAEDLYPGVKGRSLESFIQDIVDGKGKKVYV
ncbi:hypothetical protein BKA56DRAFT_593741 [Ilyonectria sp. MPI-CAGE-AT-0026]|nr:hypothetical protein BKA56DRAFT_593741 [Ilyonectria sp. MPI-CAGE-AT-0026]